MSIVYQQQEFVIVSGKIVAVLVKWKPVRKFSMGSIYTAHLIAEKKHGDMINVTDQKLAKNGEEHFFIIQSIVSRVLNKRRTSLILTIHSR